MQPPNDATVAVADGEKFSLYRNAGDEAELKLVAVSHDATEDHHKGGGAGRHSSSANQDGAQDAEDGFSEGVAHFLNKSVLGGRLGPLLLIAAPRTLGALRKQYHDKVSAALVGEVAKELTGHSMGDIEKAVIAAQSSSKGAKMNGVKVARTVFARAGSAPVRNSTPPPAAAPETYSPGSAPRSSPKWSPHAARPAA